MKLELVKTATVEVNEDTIALVRQMLEGGKYHSPQIMLKNLFNSNNIHIPLRTEYNKYGTYYVIYDVPAELALEVRRIAQRLQCGDTIYADKQENEDFYIILKSTTLYDYYKLHDLASKSVKEIKACIVDGNGYDTSFVDYSPNGKMRFADLNYLSAIGNEKLRTILYKHMKKLEIEHQKRINL